MHWHDAKKVPMPTRLIPERLPQMAAPRERDISILPLRDQRKLALHSMMPLSTQRALIQHYMKVVAPEYSLLPSELETSLLAHDNPLRWSSSNQDNPSAIAVGIAFATSASMVARDEQPTFSSVAVRCKEDLQSLSNGGLSIADPLEATRWTCIVLASLVLASLVLASLALYELITPTSYQVWDVLGAAVSVLEYLRQGYRSRRLSLDKEFQRLECSLLKLERYLYLAF